MSWGGWILTGIGLLAAPVTGGASLLLCLPQAKELWNEDKNKREAENRQLTNQASKEIKNEVNNIQDKRSQDVSQLSTLDQQLAQKQNKLNDPNVSETEKVQIRSEIASMVSQRSAAEQRIKDYDKKIEDLLKSIPGAKTPGTQIDLNKLLLIGGAGLAIYFLVIKDKEK